MLIRSGEKGLNDFRFGTFVGRFQSDGTANMAVKGLKFSGFAQCCCGSLSLAWPLFFAEMSPVPVQSKDSSMDAISRGSGPVRKVGCSRLAKHWQICTEITSHQSRDRGEFGIAIKSIASSLCSRRPRISTHR